MYKYNYNRELTELGYNINREDLFDLEGNQISLTQRIKEILNKDVNILCLGTDCDIYFEEELSSAEKTLLNTIIENYKRE
jgi:uncharacterized protein YbgA (DUF1722 family)